MTIEIDEQDAEMLKTLLEVSLDFSDSREEEQMIERILKQLNETN